MFWEVSTMARVFFGKMNVPKQTEEKVYRTSDRGFLGDIQIGDYAFIKLEKETQPATVKRLWRLKDIQETDGEFTAIFDEICQFNPIQLLKFEALDLFVLDMNLLNKCNKQTKGLSFYNISLTDEEHFEQLVSDSNQFIKYLEDAKHYRKIVKVEDKEQLSPDTIDVQFYKEGESWFVADSKCIGNDLKDNYDASQFDLFDKYGKKGTNTAKDKMYSFLTGSDIDVPMMGVWDLFCGTVKENTETKKISDKKDDVLPSGESEEVITPYILYDYSLAKHSGINKVFYGTPGCGKSYYVENVVLAQEEIDENFVFRTTFFQDYTNTDFIGQILPKVDVDGNVTYEFNPGPFTLALKCAVDNPDEKVALVIEELNRGNAPSIFGDIFQLLDRKNGTSRYRVVNVNIQTYLKKESLYDLEYIMIPANLYIYATMNTSDQNVFTLDTAFKRRWKFEKLTNEFLGKDVIRSKFVPGLQGVTWRRFVETINKFIISHATSLSAEDKQLGKYFVDDDLLMDSEDDYSGEKMKEFAYKVFEYLWTDVAKFNRTDWFVSEIKSLDILIYKFMNHENVFVPGLASELPVYVPEEEEK